MPNNPYPKRAEPRLVIEIGYERQSLLMKHLEYGMRKRIFLVIIDDVIDMLEEYGQHFIIAIMEKRISYGNFMNSYAQRKLDGDNRRLANNFANDIESGGAAAAYQRGALPTPPSASQKREATFDEDEEAGRWYC